MKFLLVVLAPIGIIYIGSHDLMEFPIRPTILVGLADVLGAVAGTSIAWKMVK